MRTTPIERPHRTICQRQQNNYTYNTVEDNKIGIFNTSSTANLRRLCTFFVV